MGFSVAGVVSLSQIPQETVSESFSLHSHSPMPVI